MKCSTCDGQCSCHVNNPPCSFCVSHEYCDICGELCCKSDLEEVTYPSDGDTRNICSKCLEEAD